MLPELESLKNVITNSGKFSFSPKCWHASLVHTSMWEHLALRLGFGAVSRVPGRAAMDEEPDESSLPGAEAEPSSAISGTCALQKQRNAYQIANGAEIKHSF